jgi:WD40 repeat protein
MKQDLPTICIYGSGATVAGPVAFHPTRHLLAAYGIRPRVISLIDCKSGTVEDELPVIGVPDEMTFDSTGEHILAVGADQIWIIKIDAHPAVIHTISTATNFADDESPVFLVSKQGIWVFALEGWQLWNPSHGRCLATITSSAGERLVQAACVSSANSVAVTYDEEMIHNPEYALSVWSLESGLLVSQLTHSEWHGVTISHDASVAALKPSGSKEIMSIWDLKSGLYLRDIIGVRPTGDREFCADNQRLVTGVPNDKDLPSTWLLITDATSGQQQCVDPATPYLPRFWCSPFHNIFVTVANDRRHPVDVTKFWEPTTGRELGSTTRHFANARHQFSRCGRWFATAGDDLGAEKAVTPLPGGSVVITDMASIVSK